MKFSRDILACARKPERIREKQFSQKFIPHLMRKKVITSRYLRVSNLDMVIHCTTYKEKQKISIKIFLKDI